MLNFNRLRRPQNEPRENGRRVEHRRPAPPAEPQPQARLPRFEGLKKYDPVFVVAAVLACIFTLVRLVVVAKFTDKRHVGIPGLCYGMIAYLDYGSFNDPAAFMLSSISNSLAISTGEAALEEACPMKAYLPGGSSVKLNTICAYLIAVSAINMFAIPPILAGSWYRLTTRGFGNIAAICYLVFSFLSWGLEVGSLYLAVIRRDPATLGLTIMIFVCTLVLLALNGSIYAAIFRRDIRTAQPDRGGMPTMVDIYNPSKD